MGTPVTVYVSGSLLRSVHANGSGAATFWVTVNAWWTQEGYRSRLSATIAEFVCEPASRLKSSTKAIWPLVPSAAWTVHWFATVAPAIAAAPVGDTQPSVPDG